MNRDTLALQLLFAGYTPATMDDDEARCPNPGFMRHVRDRLSYFLESVDRCDILFVDERDGRFVFLVSARTEEHLPLIMNAIAQERPLLAELRVDPREIRLQWDFIRIDVPMPDETDAA